MFPPKDILTTAGAVLMAAENDIIGMCIISIQHFDDTSYTTGTFQTIFTTKVGDSNAHNDNHRKVDLLPNKTEQAFLSALCNGNHFFKYSSMFIVQVTSPNDETSYRILRE